MPGCRRLHLPGRAWRRESCRQMRCPTRSAVPAERSWKPASAPANGKTCAVRARQWPSFDSWLHPRSLRHHELVSLLEFVAQLSSCVMDEDIVQSGVLNTESFHRHARLYGEFHQFGCGARPVAGQHAKHPRAFRLHGSDIVQAMEFLLPIGRRTLELCLDYV